MGTARIGISGWNYRDWRGDFYPQSLRSADWLGFAASVFDTIEINGTFYSLRSPDDFRRWYDVAPDGFRFAIKGSRFITHNKRLEDPETSLANFFASGVLELRGKLGPFLWQLPGQLQFDTDRVDTFLEALPRDTRAARRLARRHDSRVGDVSYAPGSPNRRIRHVIEPRHASFLGPEFVRIARRHGVAIAFSDASTWPYTEEVTAGFVYVRLHGPGEVYTSGYSSKQLRRWAERIERWRGADEVDDAVRITDLAAPRRKSRDVYVYFDNDAGGYAPHNAQELMSLLGTPNSG